MAVRKKVIDPQSAGDSIDLSSKLNRVREAIRQLPHEEGDVPMTNDQQTSSESSESSGKAPAKKSSPKKVTKKATPKKAAAKASNGAGGTTLAEIAKSLKMEPRKARRLLRNAGNKVPAADGDSRWTWKAAGDVAKVKKLLQDATAE